MYSTVSLKYSFTEDTSIWVLLLAPYGTQWEHIIEPFTQASLDHLDKENVNVSKSTFYLP